MRICCPFCGERDVQEFAYLGDASLRQRPAVPSGPVNDESLDAAHDYVYVRVNAAEAHAELWYHAAGCRQWLQVTRDLRTHGIQDVAAVRSDAQRRGAA